MAAWMAPVHADVAPRSAHQASVATTLSLWLFVLLVGYCPYACATQLEECPDERWPDCVEQPTAIDGIASLAQIGTRFGRTQRGDELRSAPANDANLDEQRRDNLDTLETMLLSAKITVSTFMGQMIDRQAPMLFVHIHKAGGSVMCYLANLAGERTPGKHTNCNWPYYDGYQQSGDPKAFPNCITRSSAYHSEKWTYGQMEREVTDGDLCPGFRLSVLLRDPLSLMESQINYDAKYYDGKSAWEHVEEMRRLAAEGASGTEKRGQGSSWKFMDNIQTRLLGGAIDVAAGHVTSEHVEIAKLRLARFHVVGKLEDIADPAKQQQFFAKMGWNISLEAAPHRNSVEHLDHFTAEDRDWLRELNKHDYDLYRLLDAPEIDLQKR